MNMNIIISPTGQIKFVHDDSMTGLIEQGEATIVRVSHVEPMENGRWQADMNPVGGPVLAGENGEGFRLRGEALHAERVWLSQNMGL